MKLFGRSGRSAVLLLIGGLFALLVVANIVRPEAFIDYATVSRSPGYFTLTSSAKGEPELVLYCKDPAKPWVSFFVEDEAKPTPLAGTFATLAIDGEPAEKVEISWVRMERSVWQPRGEAESARWARRIARAKSVEFTPPADYSDGETRRWHVPATNPLVEQARKKCDA